MSMNKDWHVETDHEILVACVGYNFGPNPENKIDEVRIARGGYGATIAQRLRLTKDDVVLDIGSGCGFVGRTIVPLVKQLHCVDISKNFLSYCSRELAPFENAKCHLIKYADYSCLNDASISCAYSSAVWIHFNYYDFYHNLTALRKILPSGGRLYFDYADPEGLDPNGEGYVTDGLRIFNEHATGYYYNREAIFNLVQYNGISAVKAVLTQTGFRLVERWQTSGTCFSILAEKV